MSFSCSGMWRYFQSPSRASSKTDRRSRTTGTCPLWNPPRPCGSALIAAARLPSRDANGWGFPGDPFDGAVFRILKPPPPRPPPPAPRRAAAESGTSSSSSSSSITSWSGRRFAPGLSDAVLPAPALAGAAEAAPRPRYCGAVAGLRRSGCSSSESLEAGAGAARFAGAGAGAASFSGGGRLRGFLSPGIRTAAP